MHTLVSRAKSYAKIKQRKSDWFKANGPCRKCGAWENLELDHIDPATKVSHNIWSWSDLKRAEELAKCQPLCFTCHKVKTKEFMQTKRKFHPHGTRSRYDQRYDPCRCSLCRETHAVIVKQWKLTKRD